ncbi:MAG: hypothetical protein HYX32_14110 [Actinobacteria bacterium]|nr:hypothetical protein [Actinomycetota bacterium]
MQREIRPAWLVRLAEELGGVGAGQGQPRNTSGAVPNGSDAEIYGLARHVSHSSIKQVCSYVSGDNPPKHLGSVVDRLRLNADLSAVANAFVELQQQREEADYNHLADFTRPGVLALVARSMRAIELVDQNAGSDDFRAFLGLITLRTSIGQT